MSLWIYYIPNPTSYHYCIPWITSVLMKTCSFTRIITLAPPNICWTAWHCILSMSMCWWFFYEIRGTLQRDRRAAILPSIFLAKLLKETRLRQLYYHYTWQSPQVTFEPSTQLLENLEHRGRIVLKEVSWKSLSEQKEISVPVEEKVLRLT